MTLKNAIKRLKKYEGRHVSEFLYMQFLNDKEVILNTCAEKDLPEMIEFVNQYEMQIRKILTQKKE